MSNYATQSRILFVTPEAAFMPEGGENRTSFIGANAADSENFPIGLISNLFELGADVHVVQPDFRKIFEICSRKEKAGLTARLPYDRVHLAEDRAFFYSKPVTSNSEWKNIKISLAFQREVINQIIPRIQPNLIHCYDWMTGMIPAAAKKLGISCLFTVRKFDTATSLLSCVEDIGIDAAGFWQKLFYDRYPGSYEQTRDTNPLDLLLSGILAASHVNTASPILLPYIAEGRSDYSNSPLGQLLAQKWKAGCACQIPGPPHIGFTAPKNKKLGCKCRFNDSHAGDRKSDRVKRQSISSSENWTTAKCYIDLYERILRRPLANSEDKKIHPINENSHTKASGARAIAYPKTRHAMPYPIPNERKSIPAMVPI